MLGIPPFGGFIAKLTILKGLVSIEEYLMIGLILTLSLVEATYFFRLLGNTRSSETKIDITIPIVQKTVLGFVAILILYFGIFPEMLLDISKDAAIYILGGANV